MLENPSVHTLKDGHAGRFFKKEGGHPREPPSKHPRVMINRWNYSPETISFNAERPFFDEPSR